ncbi:uncharacterized protein LOC129600881 [Paramacrobiotus metropolitanus]|uniref:uncharacterized protein LOC129600881 n=1 Tax=Paramacrobiotus metropolitanus TaxID=2943436 RepID=UPI0024464EC6|nr:uncharacterized protein LOC129600881 [Paramacrobiotus metropolitanus]
MLSYWPCRASENLAAQHVNSSDSRLYSLLIATYSVGWPLAWSGVLLILACLPLVAVAFQPPDCGAMPLEMGLDHLAKFCTRALAAAVQSDTNREENEADDRANARPTKESSNRAFNTFWDGLCPEAIEWMGCQFKSLDKHRASMPEETYISKVLEIFTGTRAISCELEFCVCASWAHLVLAPLMAFAPYLWCSVLPTPLVELFLPERLQLPGLLLLLTGIIVWAYGIFIRSVRTRCACGEHASLENHDAANEED